MTSKMEIKYTFKPKDKISEKSVVTCEKYLGLRSKQLEFIEYMLSPSGSMS